MKIKCPSCQKIIVLDDAKITELIECESCGAKIRRKPKASDSFGDNDSPKAKVKANPTAEEKAKQNTTYSFDSDDETEVPEESEPMPPGKGSKNSGESKQSKGKKKNKRSDERRSKTRAADRDARNNSFVKKLMIIGGVVLIVVALIFVFMTMFGGESASAVVAKARPAQEKQIAGEAASKRGIIPDESTWKVQADPIELAQGLKSAFAFPAWQYGESIVNLSFSDPTAGRMLCRYSNGNVYLYDLKQVDPVNRIPFDGNRIAAAAMNGKGDRVAVLSVTPEKRYSLKVIGFDGKPQLTIDQIEQAPYKKDQYYDESIVWVGFTKEDNILVHTHGLLSCFNRDSKAAIYSIPTTYIDTPRLTPGRSWIYGLTKPAYEFIDAGTGQVAGKLKLPESWLAQHDGVRHKKEDLDFAVDATGAKGVYYVKDFGNLRGLHVGVIDLASGRSLDFGKLQNRVFDHISPNSIAIDGDKILMQSGLVFTTSGLFALNQFECETNLLKVDGVYPDKRFWRFATFDARDKFHEKAGTKLTPRSLVYLVASSAPADASMYGGGSPGSIGNIPWPKGTPVRVEATGSGGSSHLTGAADKLANAIAQLGYPIDPNSKNIIRIETEPPNQSETTVAATQGEITKAEKGWAGPNAQWRKKVMGLAVTCSIHTLDGSGKKAQVIANFTGVDPDQNESKALSKLRDQMFAGMTGSSVYGPEGPPKPPRPIYPYVDDLQP